jgi:hypothetical protein
VLLQVAGGVYVAVGWQVIQYRARPNDEVIDFVSPMGNNAVPYPYAVGRRNHYLTMGAAVVPNAEVADTADGDPYDVMYAWPPDRKARSALPGRVVLHDRHNP